MFVKDNILFCVFFFNISSEVIIEFFLIFYLLTKLLNIYTKRATETEIIN